MIKDLGNGRYQLWAADGSRALGPETTKEAAYKQEVAIWNAQRKEANGPRVEDVTPDMLDNRTPIWEGGDVDRYQMGETPVDESTRRAAEADEQRKRKAKK